MQNLKWLILTYIFRFCFGTAKEENIKIKGFLQQGVLFCVWEPVPTLHSYFLAIKKQQQQKQQQIH